MLDHPLPDGMSHADFRRHPVRTLIRDAAFHGTRGLPSTAELAALDLPGDQVRMVGEACRNVAAVHDTGHHADAWKQGDEAAARIILDLPAELQQADYLRPDRLAGVDDPAALADAVPRMGDAVARTEEPVPRMFALPRTEEPGR